MKLCVPVLLVVMATLSAAQNHHIVICEGYKSDLICGFGKVIKVISAVYGRSNRDTCSSRMPQAVLQDVKCTSTQDSVAEKCDGKNTCVVSANSDDFGDPCYGTYKYLTVTYGCACQ